MAHKIEYNVVSAEINAVKISKVLPKENSIEAVIFFNDGMAKEITRTIHLNSPAGATKEVIDDIINIERRINSSFDGKTLQEHTVNIVLNNKENVITSLEQFFKGVSEAVERVRQCQKPEVLLDLVRNVLRMEFKA